MVNHLLLDKIQVESDMRPLKFRDKRIISDMRSGALIDRHTEGIIIKKKFQKNQTAVLRRLGERTVTPGTNVLVATAKKEAIRTKRKRAFVRCMATSARL